MTDHAVEVDVSPTPEKNNISGTPKRGRKTTISKKKMSKPQTDVEGEKSSLTSRTTSTKGGKRRSASSPRTSEIRSRDAQLQHGFLEKQFQAESGRGQEDGISIVITETMHSRMRKVSILCMDDPVDEPRDQTSHPSETHDALPRVKANHKGRDDNSNNSPGRAKDKESNLLMESNVENDGRATTTKCLTTDVSRKSSERHRMQKPNGQSNIPIQCNNVVASQLPLHTYKSTAFAFPDALLSDESARRHQRRWSLNDNQCLVEVEVQRPNRNGIKEQTSMRAASENGSAEGPISSQDSLNETRHITRSGTEVRGVIVPSPRSRQLMRQVSALGLEDPVFGNICDQLNPLHASNIFADMDFADVPEDMRDMLTLASDRTDVVATDDFIEESPPAKSLESKETAPLSSSTESSMDAYRLPLSGLPPLGFASEKSSKSFAGHTRNRRNATSQSNQMLRTATRVPNPSPLILSTKAAIDVIESSGPTKLPAANCTTPAVGVNTKMASTRNPHRTKTTNACSPLLLDDTLAAQVDAMFQNSSTSLNKAPGKPKHSSISSSKGSSNSPSTKNGGSSCRRNHARHTSYVPPGPPMAEPTLRRNSDAQKNTGHSISEAPHRILPSLDAIFPSSGGVDADEHLGRNYNVPPIHYTGRKWKTMDLSTGMRVGDVVGGSRGANLTDPASLETKSRRPEKESKHQLLKKSHGDHQLPKACR
jgi:hypothetical protein